MSGVKGPGAGTAHSGHGWHVGTGETTLGGSEQTLFQRQAGLCRKEAPGPCGASGHHTALLMGQ